jgi:hypothetical protein
MKTGFYNINKLSTVDLKKFFKEAIMLSYDTHIDILDCDISYSRQRDNTKTIQEMIDDSNSSYHNICIDRSIQYKKSNYGEIGYVKISGNPQYFLYIYVSLDNLEKLTKKYNLIMN